MDLELKSRTALVTGASIGIGRGIALGLAREGVRLAIVARRGDLLETLADEIEAAGGAAAGADRAGRHGRGRRRASIAAAALAGLGARRHPHQQRRRQPAVAGRRARGALGRGDDAELHAPAPAHPRAAAADDRAQAGAASSTSPASRSPRASTRAFCAKAAVHAWAKGLSREVGKHGITVNCIPPGRIMSEQIRRNYPPEYRKWQAENEIPVGRYGEPEDVAALVVFLASPLAGYITGTVIPVDGGLAALSVADLSSWPGLSRPSTSFVAKVWMPGTRPGMTSGWIARLIVANRRSHDQKHQIDQPGVRDRMLDARRQEDEVVLAHDMVLARDLHQPLAFEHVIDLLLHLVLVARDMGHRLVHRDAVVEMARAAVSGITSGFDSAPPK